MSNFLRTNINYRYFAKQYLKGDVSLFQLASAQSTTTVNTGDIIFQLVSLVFLLAIPVGIIIFVVIIRRRNSRLKRVEEKLDKLLADKDNSKV
jgi:methyl-accepting chemotaxis protein